MKKLKNNQFERMKKGAVVTLCVLMMAGNFSSCGKREESSSQGIYYVVGYDGTAEIDFQKGTAKSGGYIFVSENFKDSLMAMRLIFDIEEYRYGDVLEGIIDLPIEAFLAGGCGWRCFPEEYRFDFKVQINSYRAMTEKESKHAARIVNAMCYNPFWHSGERYKHVVITSISKIQ
jgi:hypothetical protein